MSINKFIDSDRSDYGYISWYRRLINWNCKRCDKPTGGQHNFCSRDCELGNTPMPYQVREQ